MFKLEIRCGSDMRNNYNLDSSLPTSVSIERLNNRSLMVWGSSQTLLDDMSTSTPHLNTPIETEWGHITLIQNKSTLKSVPKVAEKVPDSTAPAPSPNPPTPKREERRYSLRERKPPERFYWTISVYLRVVVVFFQKGSDSQRIWFKRRRHGKKNSDQEDVSAKQKPTKVKKAH